MKTNKEVVLGFLKAYHKKNPSMGLSTLEISQNLGMQRTNVSAILNGLVESQEIEKSESRPVLYKVKEVLKGIQDFQFDTLIGYDKSLKNAIQSAKASLLYPSGDMNILLLGEKGTGKTYFAEIMYQFAIDNNLISNKNFVKFNCKNFDGDEEVLMESLFGKPTETKINVIDQSRNGILLMDNIQLLPSVAKNKLLELIDVKSYTYHNSTDVQSVKSLLLCTADDNITKSFFDVYMSKFPTCISLPPLKDRIMTERFELIKNFFAIEVGKINKSVQTNAEILRCLLLYNCPGNIKQLKRDIQIGCANAFVREYEDKNSILKIFISDMEEYVRRGFLNYKNNREEVEEIISSNYDYIFTKEEMQKNDISIYKKTDGNIYQYITGKVEELNDRGISQDDVGLILSIEIENTLKNYRRELSNRVVNTEELEKIVDKRIIKLVSDFLNKASTTLHSNYDPSVFYGLALHLNATIERVDNFKTLSGEQITTIVENYKSEYAFSLQFSDIFEKEMGIRLPIDEVVLITMFICDEKRASKKEHQPVVLIAMHGDDSATAIAKVINNFVRTDNVHAFNLSLDWSGDESYNHFSQCIKEIDCGKGVLVIYDMGSIKTMCDMVVEQEQIAIKTINIPITLVGIESARKSNFETNLDDLHKDVTESIKNFTSNGSLPVSVKESIIVTLCTTGVGGAKQLKQMITESAMLGDKQVIAMSIADEYFHERVMMLVQKFDIYCFVGTYNPNILNIPFIPISEVFEKYAEYKKHYGIKQREIKNDIDYAEIYAYLEEQLTFVDIEKIRKYLPKAIGNIIASAKQFISTDQELGLFVHLACSLNRMIANEPLPKNLKKKSIIDKHLDLYKTLVSVVKPLEKQFAIIFPDDEIATIIVILLKL